VVSPCSGLFFHGERQKIVSHLVPRFYLPSFNFSSLLISFPPFFSFFFFRYIAHMDIMYSGEKKRRINLMALNSYFYFFALPFSLRPLTPNARPKSERERADRHNVYNVFGFFFLLVVIIINIIIVIAMISVELCHGQFAPRKKSRNRRKKFQNFPEIGKFAFHKDGKRCAFIFFSPMQFW
jgi:hypothetical protein